MAVAPPFEGRHILLRPLTHADVPTLTAYLNHADLLGRRYLDEDDARYLPLTEDRLKSMIEKSVRDRTMTLGVVRASDGLLVGHAQVNWHWDPLTPSVGMAISPAQWRSGYGSEALALILDYLFGYTPAHVANGFVESWNEVGRAFMLKHGFDECGAERRSGMRAGKYVDTVVYELFRRNWLARPKGGR